MRQRAGVTPNGHAPLFVALLTPLTLAESVDVAALDAHARDLLAAGVEGFLICGTTGEGPLLDDDEVVAVTRAVVKASGGRGKVMTQVGRPSTAATIRLLARAREAGADGVVVVAPYYYELDDPQVEAHYASVLAAAGDAPVYGYAIPRRTGNDLRPALVRRLAELGLAGIKDSTRSFERHQEYMQIAGERGRRAFGVYMGSDGLILPALVGGSTGIVSAVGNARPDLLVALRAAVEQGRSEDAGRLQSEIDAVRESVRIEGTIQGLKAAVATRMAPRGVAYSTAVRAPLGAPIR